MNKYLIFTTEGLTFAPDSETEVENCQLLGEADGDSLDDAIDNLYNEEQWIEEYGFDRGECFGEQILTTELKKDISEIVDYLYENEKIHYEKNDCPKDHIFNVIVRLAKAIK